MEHNPELEKAEAELQEELRKERETRKCRGRVPGAWTDNAIGVAAILHFVAAVGWMMAFVAVTVLWVSGMKVPNWLWVCSLPAAVASLGVALALVRVLELTARRTNEDRVAIK